MSQKPVYSEFEREVIEGLTQLRTSNDAIVTHLGKLNGSVARHSEWISGQTALQPQRDLAISELQSIVKTHQSIVDRSKGKLTLVLSLMAFGAWVIQTAISLLPAAK